MKKIYQHFLAVILFMPAASWAQIAVDFTTNMGCQVEALDPDVFTAPAAPPGFQFTRQFTGQTGEVFIYTSSPSTVWFYDDPSSQTCPANGTDIGSSPVEFANSFSTACLGFNPGSEFGPPSIFFSSDEGGPSSIVQDCDVLSDEPEDEEETAVVTPPAPKPEPKPTIGDATGSIINNPLVREGTADFSLGSAIENLCPQLAFINNPRTAGALTESQRDLLQRCGDIIREGDDGTQLEGLRNMSAEELNAASINTRQRGRAQIGNIVARLGALRKAIKQTGRDTAFNDPVHPVPGLYGYGKKPDQHAGISYPAQQRGGAAGDDDEPSLEGGRWGVFASGLFASGDRDTTNEVSGYDYSSNGYTVGVDYLVNPTVVVGAALGYASTESDFFNNDGTLDADTTTVSAYGTKQLNDNWSLDGVIGIGQGDFKNVRNLDYVASGTAVSRNAISESDSDQTLFSVGASRSYYKNDWSIDLSGRLNYLDTEVDRFVETVVGDGTTGNGLGLEIDVQEIRSVSSDISLYASKAISTNWGVFIPQGSVTWYHEFEEGDESMRARFLNDPFSVNFIQSGLPQDGGGGTTIFNIPLDPVDQNYGVVGIGSTLLYPNGWSFNLGLRSIVGLANTSQVYYTLGVRKDLE